MVAETVGASPHFYQGVRGSNLAKEIFFSHFEIILTLCVALEFYLSIFGLRIISSCLLGSFIHFKMLSIELMIGLSL